MIIKHAEESDLPIIIKLLADDILGSKRENYMIPIPKSYYQAYKDISKDKNQELVVIKISSGDVVGTLQLTFTYTTAFVAPLCTIAVPQRCASKPSHRLFITAAGAFDAHR